MVTFQPHIPVIIEASTLGLKPGMWPFSLRSQGILMKRDRAVKDNGGEIISVVYRSFNDPSIMMEVLND